MSPEIQKQSGELLGTTYNEEWDAMPTSYEQDVLADNPDVLAQEPLALEAHKEELPAFPEIETGDRLFIGAIGSLALTGDVLSNGIKNRFDALSTKFSEIKTTLHDRIQASAESSHKDSVVPIQDFIDRHYNAAVTAKQAGDAAGAAERMTAIEGVLSRSASFGQTRRYRWAAKLGAVPSYDSQSAALLENYNQKLIAEPELLDANITAKAEAAKTSGNWTLYNQILAAEADKLQHNADYGHLSTKDLKQTISRTDNSLTRVRPNSETLANTSLIEAKQEHASAAEAQKHAQHEAYKKHVSNLINPEQVVSLQVAIQEEIGRKTKEASIFGGQQVGFDAEKLRLDVTNKYLEQYFGASSEELTEGKKVPFWVQKKVLNLLALPKNELRDRVTKKQPEAPHNVIDLREYAAGKAAKVRAEVAKAAEQTISPKPAVKSSRYNYDFSGLMSDKTTEISTHKIAA